ncbi:MAG: hypothetical protein IT577_15200 [Verrucomicrobiae bacterium]|nr:hypothetical protein [Verrucomicrobiae bacterium]
MFLLLLNPGLEPGDYYAEYCSAEFRATLRRNLRQKFDGTERYPFWPLDPKHAWHPGGRYFRKKLHWLADAVAKHNAVPYLDGLSRVAREVCGLQLLPYHSASFRRAAWVMNDLPSKGLVTDFVREVLESRDDVLVIILRAADDWDIPDGPNVVRYTDQQARAAHLTPGSPGGSALIKHFKLGPRHLRRSA